MGSNLNGENLKSVNLNMLRERSSEQQERLHSAYLLGETWKHAHNANNEPQELLRQNKKLL